MSTLIGIAVFFAVYAVIAGVRARGGSNQERWVRAADKIARDYDIAVREDVSAQVRAYLRWQSLLALLIAPAGALAGVSVAHAARSNASLLLTLALALLGVVVPAAVGVSLGRSWNQTVTLSRVAHLNRPTMRQTFDPLELALLAVGVVFAAIAGVAALLASGHPALAACWMPLVAGDTVIGRWGIQSILNRPVNAGDNLELGWDDVLRHKEARDLAGTVVWLPAALAFLLAAYSIAPAGNLIPLYLCAAAAFGLHHLFRRGRSRWQGQWGTRSAS